MYMKQFCIITFISVYCVQKRTVESNVNCRHLKKSYWERDFAVDVYLSEAQNPIPTLNTVHVYTVYLFTQGRGEERTREKVRGATVHKPGSKIPT